MEPTTAWEDFHSFLEMMHSYSSPVAINIFWLVFEYIVSFSYVLLICDGLW